MLFLTFLKLWTNETTIEDITGKKEVNAIQVFQHGIKYFRDQMLYTIEKKGLGVEESNIRWVITVPAIWSEPAKQFMTEAAELVITAFVIFISVVIHLLTD